MQPLPTTTPPPRPDPELIARPARPLPDFTPLPLAAIATIHDDNELSGGHHGGRARVIVPLSDDGRTPRQQIADAVHALIELLDATTDTETDTCAEDGWMAHQGSISVLDPLEDEAERDADAEPEEEDDDTECHPEEDLGDDEDEMPARGENQAHTHMLAHGPWAYVGADWRLGPMTPIVGTYIPEPDNPSPGSAIFRTPTGEYRWSRVA